MKAGSAAERLARPVTALGDLVMGAVRSTGDLALMTVQTLVWMTRPPFRLRLLVQQMDFVGVGSLPIVLLTGLFSGMVFALQVTYAFSLFNAESLVGSTVVLALSRELAPVLTSLMVSGRVGSAMATELGTMRVTEQIDAMETMAVNPIQYLVVPRVLATVLVLPLLVMIFIAVGSAGAYVVAVIGSGLNPGTYMARIRAYVEAGDFIQGMIKGAVFGFIVAAIGCYQGYRASGGARGVGMATTRAVVVASVVILVLDYFVTAAFF